jgi:hypothetical protein
MRQKRRLNQYTHHTDTTSYDKHYADFCTKFAVLVTVGEKEKTTNAIKNHLYRNRMQGQAKLNYTTQQTY